MAARGARGARGRMRGAPFGGGDGGGGGVLFIGLDDDDNPVNAPRGGGRGGATPRRTRGNQNNNNNSGVTSSPNAMFQRPFDNDVHPAILKQSRKSGQLNLSNKVFGEGEVDLID